ncbi:hypothetical protein GGR53DRAFT_463346 [Hypoxylon sp. FL1150]|nr:hypothetical protein GGR53DRAFT_463346 [Hypoxylon sp. FL1150]
MAPEEEHESRPEIPQTAIASVPGAETGHHNARQTAQDPEPRVALDVLLGAMRHYTGGSSQPLNAGLNPAHPPPPPQPVASGSDLGRLPHAPDTSAGRPINGSDQSQLLPSTDASAGQSIHAAEDSGNNSPSTPVDSMKEEGAEDKNDDDQDGSKGSQPKLPECPRQAAFLATAASLSEFITPLTELLTLLDVSLHRLADCVQAVSTSTHTVNDAASLLRHNDGILPDLVDVVDSTAIVMSHSADELLAGRQKISSVAVLAALVGIRLEKVVDVMTKYANWHCDCDATSGATHKSKRGAGDEDEDDKGQPAQKQQTT